MTDHEPAGAGSRSLPALGCTAWVAGATLLTMIGVVAYAAVTDTPVGLIVRDPNQVAQGRAWTGLVSTLGNGLWAASAGILFLALGTQRSSTATHRRALVPLLVLTVLLFLDDSLLLHDEVLPSIGVHEIFMVAFYAAAGVATLLLARSQLRQSEAERLFFASLALFAVSIGVDLIDPRSWGPDVLFAVEDGAKFVGIGLWTDTMFRLGRHTIRSSS